MKDTADARILLISPPPANRVETWDTPDFPNISLGYIGGAIRGAGFDNIHIIDAKFEQLDFETLISRIEKINPHIIGMTALTTDIEQIKLLVKRLIQIFPKVIMILGGTHVSTLPEQTLKEIEQLDYIIMGEGEFSIVSLLKTIVAGTDIKEIPGVGYIKNGQTIIQYPQEPKDLDMLHKPAWDLLPKANCYPVLTARGCPFNCQFCNPMSVTLRDRSVDNVLDELKWVLSTFYPNRLWFFDETFGLNKKRLAKLLTRMIDIGVPQKVTWSAFTRISITDHDMLNLMYKAGCRQIGFGIEAGSKKILKAKQINVRHAESLIRHSKKLGMAVEAFFIFGHPDETVFDLLKTIRLAAKLNPTTPVFGIMVPFPGTIIYDMAKNNKGGYRLTATNWNDYNKHLGNAVEFTKIGNTTVEILRMLAYFYFYLSNRRIGDLKIFIKTYWKMGVKVLALLPKRMFPHLFNPPIDAME